MASFQPTKTGVRAYVCVKGVRDTAQHRTMREAKAWAASRETELRENASKPAGVKYTLGQAIDRYLKEVVPEHKGSRWEDLRLRLLKDYLPTDKEIGHVTTDDIGACRDARLKKVSNSSVLRELNILGSFFETARREWKWITENPVRDVRKPKESAHRDRLISRSEIRAMLTAMGYSPGQPCKSSSQAAAVAFLVALRCGMRAGELCKLTWDRVHPHHCHLDDTKTVARDVPLSRKTKRLIELMRGWDKKTVFGMKDQTLSALFYRYRGRAGLDGFVFHDSRHTAATWLGRSGKIDVLSLCKMFGWSNPKMAMVYFNPTAADIAKGLD